MVAPGGGELDHPDLVAGVDDVVEIILVKINHIAFGELIRQVRVWLICAAIKLHAEILDGTNIA